MKLERVAEGDRFTVFALVLDNGSCPALEFLTEVEKSNTDSFDQLVAAIERHSNHGPLKSKRHSNALDDKVFEFKCRGIERIAYFYTPGRVTILTHGFKKPKNYSSEIRRARALMEAWEALQ